ncbi:VRR-NUC domain containing protein [uncultured Caudovirales phage]|uniref:VRR-NUC domain containing protein n=1 Tax=uncultured Caudovirales phage TaxID=2100421 RepID=A0A6J5PBU8_9CAUD|nr:VRR-NUC domain containing protein [uncultured Caudovirales phage]CAB4183560.1 VRR-NUC domain containing protein [uncultured Caudovirales phage]CAB4214169.1 VRR-NUC domain containing protein [uncultured Caudovirales phage]CAB4219298.1 VRR-NUC domain containing protein [uncultured Caudovirales phage]
MILEKDIERHLVHRVAERGGVAYKWVSPGRVGVADRIVLLPGGRVWFVELKTVKGRLSPLQKVFAADMARMGMNYLVIKSKEEVDQWILTQNT